MPEETPTTLPSLVTGMGGGPLDPLGSIVVVGQHVTCTMHMNAWSTNEFVLLFFQVLLKSLLPQ